MLVNDLMVQEVQHFDIVPFLGTAEVAHLELAFFAS